MGNQITRNILMAVGVIVLAFLVYAFMTAPDQRNAAERVGDAIHELPQGPDKAAKQLGDRSPAQRLGDTIQDNTTGSK